jgi:hypothetical protein
MLHPLFPWWWLLYPSLLVPNAVSLPLNTPCCSLTWFLPLIELLWYPDNTWHCQDLYTQRLEVMVRVRILPNKHSKAWAVCWRKEI